MQIEVRNSRDAHRRTLSRGLGLALGFGAVWMLLSQTPSFDTPSEPQAQTQGMDDGIALMSSDVMPQETVAAAAAVETPPAFEPRRETSTLALQLRSGDTLIETLTDAGAPTRDAYRALTALGKLINLKRLQVGQEIDLHLETRQDWAEAPPLVRLAQLSVRSDFDKRIIVSTDTTDRKAGYTAVASSIPTLKLAAFGEGIIDDSLFLAAERADVPVEIIIELIRMFSFSVDFQREIWPGDSFAVYYERDTIIGDVETENYIKEGNILFARLTLRGKEHSLYRFGPENGAGKDARVDYFDDIGKSARRALMKTPIDGARLSSRYGRRKHPVLGYVRNHPGVDFSTGRSGTPIYAAGDGVIQRASKYSTYGNYVRIRHNSTYETAYAHLSKYGRGIKKGVRVKQGQVIGYTGATGRVTGPHLHYEVYVNGSRVNPTTLKLPTGRTLKKNEFSAFALSRESADEAIASLRNAQRIALQIREDNKRSALIGPPAPGAAERADTSDQDQSANLAVE